LISKNRITSNLPTLPNSITNFQCHENLLTVSSIPNLPNNLQTLSLGTTNDNATYRNNFTTLFQSDYGSMNAIQTITAQNCGLTVFNSRFGSGNSTTLTTLNLNNAGTTRANTFSSIDISRYTSLTSLNLSFNTNLTTISNLNSASSLNSFSAETCLLTSCNFTFPNTLKTISLSRNNFGANFTSSLASLTAPLNLNFLRCGLTSAIINQILNQLVTGNSTNGTLNLGNSGTGGAPNFNSDASSGGVNGNNLRNILCSPTTSGGKGWTCTFCDTAGAGPCAT
jgi:hypothetical protein